MSEFKHTPGPWELIGPMGTEHLHGAEPWFWVSADRTLHLRVAACSDGYVVGENEANARLIAAAPRMYARIEMLASEGDAEAQEIVEAVNGRA